MSFFKTRTKYLIQQIQYQIQNNKPLLSLAIQVKNEKIVVYYLFDYFYQMAVIPQNKISENIIWENEKLISELDWNDLLDISKNIQTLSNFEDLNSIIKEYSNNNNLVSNCIKSIFLLSEKIKNGENHPHEKELGELAEKALESQKKECRSTKEWAKDMVKSIFGNEQ